MQTTKNETRDALKVALAALCYSLLLLGLMRLGWIERVLLLPFTEFQAGLAESLGWTRSRAVVVSLSCSGSDVLALCMGAISAYPVSRRARLVGCLGGLGLIVALNTARIGTLWHTASSPEWFDTLHVYIWPAILMVAVVGYVLTWIVLAHRGFRATPYHGPRGRLGPVQLTPRFLVLTAASVLVFVALAPWYLNSSAVLALAAWMGSAAVGVAAAFGVDASMTGNIVRMSGSSFLVTQACISTPLIPVGAAIAVSLPISWPRRALALLCVGPLFVALGIVRLLVLTVPETLVPSAVMLTHAFFQLLVALPIVILAAVWRHGLATQAWQRAAIAIGWTLAATTVAGAVYTQGIFTSADVLLHWIPTGDVVMSPPEDPQSALAMLPAYQIALFSALWLAAFADLGWKRFGMGLGILAFSAVALLMLLTVLASGAEFSPNVRYVRAWAVAAPILVAILLDRWQRSQLKSWSGVVA